MAFQEIYMKSVGKLKKYFNDFEDNPFDDPFDI